MPGKNCAGKPGGSTHLWRQRGPGLYSCLPTPAWAYFQLACQIQGEEMLSFLRASQSGKWRKAHYFLRWWTYTGIVTLLLFCLGRKSLFKIKGKDIIELAKYFRFLINADTIFCNFFLIGKEPYWWYMRNYRCIHQLNILLGSVTENGIGCQNSWTSFDTVFVFSIFLPSNDKCWERHLLLSLGHGNEKWVSNVWRMWKVTFQGSVAASSD